MWRWRSLNAEPGLKAHSHGHEEMWSKLIVYLQRTDVNTMLRIIALKVKDPYVHS